MKTKTVKRISATIWVPVVIAILMVGTAAFVLFHSFVTGKGHISAGKTDDVTMTVSGLTSGQAISVGSSSFTLKKAGDRVSFSVVLENNTTADLIHSLSVSLPALRRQGTAVTLGSDEDKALRSCILVYCDGVFVDSLAHLTQQGTAEVVTGATLPYGVSDTHVLTFELHAAAEQYREVGLSLLLTDQAQNADARQYIFVRNESQFAKAVDDINSGLLVDEAGVAITPRVVLVSDVSLLNSYTLNRPLFLDFRGNALRSSGTLELCADTVLMSSVPFSATVAFDRKILCLNAADAALEIRDFYDVNGTENVALVYADAVEVRQFDPDKVLSLVTERVRKNLSGGVPSGGSADLLSSLSFYLSDSCLSLELDGQVLDGSVLAVGERGATDSATVTLSVKGAASSETVNFKRFGKDTEAVLASVRQGALAHLEKLKDLEDAVMSDVFLPCEIKAYGVSIEWHSTRPELLSEDGRLIDDSADRQIVTLYANVRINEKVYPLSYSFLISGITNEVRFSNFVAQLSPLTLKEVWRGDVSTTSDDFVKSHQFLPNTNTGSAYHYTRAYTSPDTSLTSAKLVWEGYEDIGLTSLSYSQDATYNYVSVDTDTDGEPSVYLNTPVFSTFAQINLTATFAGDDTVYAGIVNIIIEPGNYEELLNESFLFVQQQLDETDIYKNVIRSRRQYGMKEERGDFHVNTIYSISSSSLSASKYSIVLNTAISEDVFGVTPEPLTLLYNGKQCQAYVLLDSYDSGAVLGSGRYIKVSSETGVYYVSATEAGADGAADGTNIIDGTGKYFLPVTAGYMVSVDLSKASLVESRVPISVTVSYTNTPTVTTTRTLYVTVPAVILPDENGFSNYSVFSSVKYQMFRYLPAEEQTNASAAFTVSAEGTVTNHTEPYLLVNDVERCNGKGGYWFEGEYAGEAMTIANGSRLDALYFLVGEPDASVNDREATVYDFLALLQWATGNRAGVAASDVVTEANRSLVDATVSDGKEYLTPAEESVLKNFYRNVTGIGEEEWSTLFGSVSSYPVANGARSRVISDSIAFGNAIKALTSNTTIYFKYTELMRWALNEQNFPKSAFFNSSYPLGNPPNGGSLRYNVTYTTANGNSFYFRQTTATGSLSLQGGDFNEDDTEYISEREEVVLQAFWNAQGRLAAFKTAFATYTVTPTYLEQDAVQVLVGVLYEKLGYSEFSEKTATINGVTIPKITSADGSLEALTYFAYLEKLVVKGNYSVTGDTVYAGLPAFLHTESLATAYHRLTSSVVAPALTELVLYNCAQDYVTFELDGISAFTSLCELDLGMNYGLKTLGTVLDALHDGLSYVDLSGADSADRYTNYPLLVLSGRVAQVYYTSDENRPEDGKTARKEQFSGGEMTELLAYLRELETVDGQYLQLQSSVTLSGSGADKKTLYWQIDRGNPIYSDRVTRAGTFLAGTYGTCFSAADMLGELTNFYYYDGSLYSVVLDEESQRLRLADPVSLRQDPALTEEERAELAQSLTGEMGYDFVLGSGTTIDTATNTQYLVGEGGTNNSYYASLNGTSAINSSRTRYSGIYYEETVETKEYSFIYRGSDFVEKVIRAYHADDRTVMAYTWSYGKSGEVTGKVTVKSTTYQYVAERYSATGGDYTSIPIDVGTAEYLYWGTSATNFRSSQAVRKNAYVATYAYGTWESTASLSGNSADTIGSAFLSGLESWDNGADGKAQMQADMVLSVTEQITAQETVTMSVPSLASDADRDAALERLEEIRSGVQNTVVFLFSGATTGEATYIREGQSTSYSFAGNRFYRLVWQEGTLTFEDTYINGTSATDTTVTMESILASANAVVGTSQRGNYLGMYVYYSGTGDEGGETYTVNGRTYRPGCVYRIIWADDAHTAFTYDDAAGGTRTCTEVNGNQFSQQPLNASTTGAIYYLTESANYYAANRFYEMTYDDAGGFYYLSRFGSIAPLLGVGEKGGTHGFLRMKNGKLYITSGSDYSGTGGTVDVDITVVILSGDGEDRVEYERTFRVTVIG